ncbi:GNAT family N-acetyltransferase [Faecalibacterium prausnitzii]|jgi:GNAT superfamily N-acetyltransferase|uniref:GNAT family N-acetyltransferase n=1 Tax=Faecalibacterium prausnitzii TaxID=853 RepID=UPI001C037E73|nr:GNAT family N-acetyltransferase [Faecalibacterium prausnitzii]MBT9711745.1 GNAT family N-acetyltransferase [Faecalibacterium prausnitzii]
MELILQKVCGRSAQLPIRLRRCGPADAAAFFTLQNEVRAAMPHPEQFVPDTLENITAYLREDLCIGAYDGERLGAYFILRYCGRSAHNYAAFLGVPREEWEHWANADSAVVHPDWRGNGLQRKLLEAALPLVRPGIVGIGATVSPENQYSLNNALACGFVIADRREMYGGYDRYLLKKML